MKTAPRLKLSAVCACFILAAGGALRLLADQTNSVPIPQSTDAASSNAPNPALLLQQLQGAQASAESNRLAMASLRERNAADVARVQILEQLLAAQRDSEIAATQKTTQLTLVLAAGSGTVALAAVLLMIYLQWRALARLVEVSALHPGALEPGRAPAALDVGGRPAGPARAAVELSSARLLGVVERLEHRVLELEHTARAPLSEGVSPAAGAPNRVPPESQPNGRDHLARLLSEGQSLLGADQPEKALELFEQALAIQPRHAEALVKKGGALEKLNRPEEAIACYERAIAADSSMTLAWLCKGGLFNRLARYDEALECYEQALRAQEKSRQ
ncbi:MAG: tetratricopeptide repeat protein [Verrucomicrobiota bacterium]|nr:tetratricopeptide repeat protein [Verrucomicrobiota bacterium]